MQFTTSLFLFLSDLIKLIGLYAIGYYIIKWYSGVFMKYSNLMSVEDYKKHLQQLKEQEKRKKEIEEIEINRIKKEREEKFKKEYGFDNKDTAKPKSNKRKRKKTNSAKKESDS